MTTIVTLTPFSVQLGGNDSNVTTAHSLPAPPTFGSGSVSDDSDASGVEIGTRFDGVTGHECDLFLADFQIDPGLNPTWMYVHLRAQNDPAYPNALANNSLFPVTAWYRSDDAAGDRLYSQGWPAALQDPGTVSTPTWFNYVYDNAPVDTANPGDAGNWLNLPRDVPSMLDALTTTGLRLGLFSTSSAATRVPLIDVYEVRLVVACENAATSYGIPAIRHMQRGDGELMSSAPRAFQHNSVQGSLRNLSYL